MMCCCRLSTATQQWRARYCLDMSATLSLCLACALSLEQITELGSERNQNIRQSCRPVCPMRSLCGQRWKNNSTYKNHRGFAVVPPVDRNLRRRQECVRAWSWLSSKQISMRRQVCSACLHSCSCLQLFSLFSGAAFSMWCVVKQECTHNSTTSEASSEHKDISLGVPPKQKVLQVFKNRQDSCCSLCCALFPVLKLDQSFPHIAPKFHILCFGTRESISTLWVPALLSVKLKGKNESTVNQRLLFLGSDDFLNKYKFQVDWVKSVQGLLM